MSEAVIAWIARVHKNAHLVNADDGERSDADEAGTSGGGDPLPDA